MTSRGRLLTSTVLFGTLSMAMAGSQAQAQQSADADLQEIVVTGSRLKSPNLASDSPIVSVTSQEAKFQGAVNVSSLLNNMPQILGDQSNNSSITSDGTSAVNLRGLGANRTLTLIDGKRIGIGGTAAAAADLNFIPTDLVESVDVLTGGASAIYGSDAVAGVVNFKMKRDFEGVQFDTQFGAAQHNNGNRGADARLSSSPYPVQQVPGSNFDGFNRTSSLIIGANAPNNKGNVTFYATYTASDPLNQSKRDYSACVVDGDPLACSGSSTTPFGRYSFNNFDANGNSTASYNFIPSGNGTAKFTNADRYNFATLSYLQREDQRWSGGAFAHYTINPAVEVYSDVMFMDDRSVAQYAPSGLFFGGVPGVAPTISVNCNNPLLLANPTISNAMCSGQYQYTYPNGVNAPGAYTKAPTPGQAGFATIPTPGFRFTNAARQDDYTHTDYRILGGVRGDLGGSWSYDVSAQYYHNQTIDNHQGDVSITRVNNALNAVTGSNGQVVCAGGQPGCVPFNIFQSGGITKQMTDYLIVPAVNTGGTEETVVEGNLSGDFGRIGGVSPFAKTPINAAFGFDYRHDRMYQSPDAEYTSGDLSGVGGIVPAISGGYKVTEEYAEIGIPVIEDYPFVRSFDLDLAFRHSDYSLDNSNNGYATNTWRMSADYKPVDDIKFRGGYNRATRAPDVLELFSPSTPGLVGVAFGQGSDPCANGTGADGVHPLYTQAQCANLHVSSAQYGNITDCSAGQCGAKNSGSTALKPEEADTWTWGVVVTPSFLPHLTASVDYYDIKVTNYILDNGLPANQILAGCAANGASPLCNDVVRDPGTGGLYGAGYILEPQVNGGYVHNSGLDFVVSYAQDLEDLGIQHYGSVRLDFSGSYLLSAVASTLPSQFAAGSPGNGTYDCNGLYGSTCGAPEPTWRHTMRLTWSTPWQADFSVFWRHIGGVGLDSNSSQPALNGGTTNVANANINQYNYFDLASQFVVYDHYTFNVGINNLFDRDPPIVANSIVGNLIGGNNNMYSSTYDVMGRTMYIRGSVRF